MKSSKIEFDISHIEGPLRRKPVKKFDYKGWFIDIIVGSVIAGFIIGIGAVLFLLWRADIAYGAEIPNDNESLCAGFLEGKYNVSPEDRAEVTKYCTYGK